MSLDSKRGVEMNINIEGEYGSIRSGRGAKVKKKKNTKNIFKKVRIKKIIFRYSTIKQYIKFK